jgi:hypothetical protein
MNVSNNINSAFVSGQLGLQRASNAVTDAAQNIATRSVQPVTADDSNPNITGVQSGPSSLTDDLISLSVDSTNALANAKVLKVADEMLGRIIDEQA